jgi:hypothetical protein
MRMRIIASDLVSTQVGAMIGNCNSVDHIGNKTQMIIATELAQSCDSEYCCGWEMKTVGESHEKSRQS